MEQQLELTEHFDLTASEVEIIISSISHSITALKDASQIMDMPSIGSATLQLLINRHQKLYNEFTHKETQNG